MARRRIRSQNEVVGRCAELAEEVRRAVARLERAGGEANAADTGSAATTATAVVDTDVVDAVWHGEALGTLLWALGRLELPPYDRPFETDTVTSTGAGGGSLRPEDELEAQLATARLWHWRARTSLLQAAGSVELPAGYASFDQLIAATAMRGHERGLLPVPTRGDFQAYGRVYRQLTPAQRDEAHSIATERQHALAWLFNPGMSWQDVPLDT